LWPNLIASAKASGARVAIVNGRLSEGSQRGYRRLGSLVRRVLGGVDLVAAQDEATARRFRSLGARNVVVTGSLKYDGAETDRANERTRALAALAGFCGPRGGPAGGEEVATDDGTPTVWLAGSTQAPEEAICLRVFDRLSADFPHLRLILVPRHPERFDEVAGLLTASDLTWRRRSHVGQSAISNQQSEVLLVDSVGELGAWWGLADIGFVGGSFGDRGGQNMIEPAAYGVATCFGPNTRNFRDIVAALESADAARTVNDEAELEAFVRRCLVDRGVAEDLGGRASRLVATQLGATERTVDTLLKLLGEATPRPAKRSA
ncbi:MAG: glycosyltransferase N-terminal domain-containing protein, partial [Planctomycetota bacterium]